MSVIWQAWIRDGTSRIQGGVYGDRSPNGPRFPWSRSRQPLWLLACKWCALEDLNPRPTDPWSSKRLPAEHPSVPDLLARDGAR